MIVGTAFTLLIVPSIYMLVARKRGAPADEMFHSGFQSAYGAGEQL
jgi:hypothetical protein